MKSMIVEQQMAAIDKKLAAKAEQIEGIKAQIQDFETERAATAELLSSIKTPTTNPDQAIEAGQRKAETKTRLEAISDAIKALQGQLEQVQQQHQMLEAEHQELQEQAQLQAAQLEGEALAAAGDELVDQLEAWLKQVAEWKARHEGTYRNHKVRHFGGTNPSLMPAFLEGEGIWRLPELRPHRDRWHLGFRAHDIRPPRKRYANRPGGVAQPGDFRGVREVAAKIPQKELAGLPASLALARRLGMTGPQIRNGASEM